MGDKVNSIETKKSGSAIIAILNFALMPIFITVGLFGLKKIAEFDYTKQTSCELCQFIAKLFPTELTLEAKFQVFSVALALPASIILFLTLLTMFNRVISLADPLRKDNYVINVLNNCIRNTLEQSFVFLGFFAYFLFNHADESNKRQTIDFIIMFFVSRVVFILGYFIHGITFSRVLIFRAVGFVMTLATHFIVILPCFGINAFRIMNENLSKIPVEQFISAKL